MLLSLLLSFDLKANLVIFLLLGQWLQQQQAKLSNLVTILLSIFPTFATCLYGHHCDKMSEDTLQDIYFFGMKTK